MKTYKTVLPEITLRYKAGTEFKTKITSSKDAYELFMKFYDEDIFELTESVIVLFLNRNNTTIGWMKHSVGGQTSTIIDKRLILITALKCGAIGIILSHNHPSGNLKPSDTDIKITKELKEGGRLLDISLLDHIIITTDGYFSFADEGTL